MKKIGVDIYYCCILLLLCIFPSCSSDEIKEEGLESQLIIPSSNTKKKSYSFYSNSKLPNYSLTDRFGEPMFDDPCEFTEFGGVLSGYFEKLLNDPLFNFELLSYYRELNNKYVTHYRGDNYYGENGEHNKIAAKRIRELTKFWNLDREIILNGQHTSWLDDREILTDMIESFDRSVRNRSEAYAKADHLIQINRESVNFPENPYFAFDGFTKSSGLLVIGDGLIKILSETGIDEDLTFTALLAHEWWHQAQFEHEDAWTFTDELYEPSEISRFAELEADFAGAYFLAHKRGATYNWKRIEKYFELSFNVGDCLTESINHHGTPQQRLRAAKGGFELSESAQKKGFILSATQVHEAFVKVYKLEIL